jgi:polyisoprenoid-binding protein YceI
MPETGQRHRIGPEHGRLVLHTTRQGLAAQAGHDLTIEVTRWSGEVLVADDPAASAVTVTVETGSLRVVAGTGGITPLSERDKREIAHTARGLLDADHQPEARFASTATTRAGQDDGTIDGTLTLHGTQRPVHLEVTRLDGDRYRATATVVQSEFGIKPYTALFGAIRLADPVRVEAEVDLSGREP